MKVARSFAFVNAISAAQTPAELGRQLVRLAEAFGFVSVFGGLVPRARTPKKEIAPLVLVQHVPPDWAGRYNDRGYLFRDPVFHRLQADPQPFNWADSYASCPSQADRKLVGGEAAEFGLTGGFVVPVVTLDERIAAVSFGGDRAALDPEDAGKLSFAATCAIGRFLQLHASADHAATGVSVRERECLLWSSDGKTEADIAEILEISTSTVSKHIASAKDKLGAANKAHAISLAFRKGMLT